MMLKSFVLAAVCWQLSTGASLSEKLEEKELDREKRETYDMLRFLETYGYLKPVKENFDDLKVGNQFHSEYTIQEAIRKYQEFNNLPQTGELDKATREKMKQPRCGFRDILENSDPSQPQKYTHLGTKWMKNKITWKTSRYTNQFSHSDQRKAFERALKYWSDVTPLKFEQSDDNADIQIKFARREHGDGNPFDGRGNILAHAFGPGAQPISGDTHFDDDEQWTLHSNYGTELETVAAHEFGHALGLGHSSVPGALMAPYYQGWNPNMKLTYDDIRGIQLLYGSKPNPPKPTETTLKTTTTTTMIPTPQPTIRPPSTRPYYCDMKLDAIDIGPDGYTYAFNGRYVYKTSQYTGLVGGYPKRINKVFPNAPSHVRGVVFDKKTGLFYIFKGSLVWRYSKFELDSGFPKWIDTEDFPEKPHAMLALSYRRFKTQIFMFGHKYFWEWNQDTLKMTPGYILTIPLYWRGIPEGIEAAMTTFDGKHLFFKGHNFRKMHPAYRSVMTGYPKRWSPEIFGSECDLSSDLIDDALEPLA